MRNTVGFDWHPVTKQLYFTDNGRDWASEDVPEDELNRVTKAGQHFGSPYCYQGDFPDPEFGWGQSCSDSRQPVAQDRPALGLARHALLHRQHVPGEIQERDLHRAPRLVEPDRRSSAATSSSSLNKDGTVKSSEPFITGFLVDNNYIGRPVDVLFMKDGSMLISDDWNGAIYRITYGKARTASR